MAKYEILEEYVHSQRHEIDAGKPVTVEIRDLETFERMVVKAVIGPPERPIPGAGQLVLMNLAGNVASDAWTIRIDEELDAESVEIRPQSEFRKNAREGG